MTSLNEAREAAQELLNIEGVVGIAEGEQGGRACLIILVDRPTDTIGTQLPTSLHGVPVEVRAVGEIAPQL